MKAETRALNVEQQAAEARAFKDRLVDYDRNARQRTTVVDDQNDFFEIDTNAWLDPEVCHRHAHSKCLSVSPQSVSLPCLQAAG